MLGLLPQGNKKASLKLLRAASFDNISIWTHCAEAFFRHGNRPKEDNNKIFVLKQPDFVISISSLPTGRLEMDITKFLLLNEPITTS